LVRTLLLGAKSGRLRGTAHLRWRDLSGWAGAWLRERKVLLLPGVMTLARLAARSATAEQAAGFRIAVRAGPVGLRQTLSCAVTQCSFRERHHVSIAEILPRAAQLPGHGLHGRR
jgi:hypothetical protein